MSLLDIISIFVVLANLSLGLFVWLKGRKKKTNIWFFVLTIGVSLWPIANYLSLQDFDKNTVLFWMRVVMSLAVMQGMFFLFFIISFTKQKIQIKNRLYIYYLIVVILTIIISFSPLLFSDVKFENNNRIPVVSSGLLLFVLVSIGSIAGGLTLLLRYYNKEVGITKLQSKYILIGVFVMFILLIIFNFGLVVVFHISSFVNLGPLFILPFTILTSYAILKYRLMDIRVVVRKGVVHFISIAIILFLFVYLLFFIQRFLVDQYQWNEQSSLIILVLFIALTIEPLRQFLSTVVDKVFYSKQKNTREQAKRLKLVLLSSLKFDQLINKVKTELQFFLEVKDIQFIWHNRQSGNLENYFQDDKKVSFGPTDALFHYLREHPDILVTEEIPYMMEEASNGEKEMLRTIEKKLKELNVGLVWPIGEKGELIGAFFLSQKAKKEAFTSDNVRYLSEMQFPMTNAIANALLYKQAVERIVHLKK